MSKAKRTPREGESLIWADGLTYRLTEIGIVSGAERFKATRVAEGGFHQVQGVTLGLAWDEAAGVWRYPSAATP